MDNILLNSVSEVTYLTTGSAWRYRAILRYFYLQYEQLRYYLFPEEVLEFLKESPHFAEYTEELLQQDLTNWLAGKILFPGRIPARYIALKILRRKGLDINAPPIPLKLNG